MLLDLVPKGGRQCVGRQLHQARADQRKQILLLEDRFKAPEVDLAQQVERPLLGHPAPFCRADRA